MKISRFLALSTIAAGLAVSVGVYAKDIKIAANNTTYSEAHIQQLAATATKMGVNEPVSVNRSGNSVVLSGSNATKCTFKVADGNALQIQGVSCK